MAIRDTMLTEKHCVPIYHTDFYLPALDCMHRKLLLWSLKLCVRIPWQVDVFKLLLNTSMQIWVVTLCLEHPRLMLLFWRIRKWIGATCSWLAMQRGLFKVWHIHGDLSSLGGSALQDSCWIDWTYVLFNHLPDMYGFQRRKKNCLSDSQGKNTGIRGRFSEDYLSDLTTEIQMEGGPTNLMLREIFSTMLLRFIGLFGLTLSIRGSNPRGSCLLLGN